MNGSRFHLVMTVIWVLLLIPTIVWWRDSVLWVAVMSIWSNVVGHWGAYEAARGEERLEKKLDGVDPDSEDEPE